jgi:hypothetical protein
MPDSDGVPDAQLPDPTSASYRAIMPTNGPSLACPFVLAMGLGGCGDAAANQLFDPATVPAERMAEAILEQCHQPLRGRMQELTATVHRGSEEWQVIAAPPDRARVQGTDAVWLLRDQHVVRLPTGEPASTADAQRVHDLLRLVDAVAFGPLHRATRCRAAAADAGQPNAYALAQPDGSDVTLTLLPRTSLPHQLRWPNGDCVDLLAYQHTGTTWIAQGAASERLGGCRVRLDHHAVGFAADLFALPQERAGTAPAQRMVAPGTAVESRSPTPILIDGKALQLWCVPDPGDWPGRTAAYTPLHRELETQQQQIAGFPCLWQQDEQRWLAAPFRARQGGPEFAAPATAQLRTLAAGRWLVVYPPAGDVAARIAEGERLLQAGLVEQRLTARGPITAQPHFHLHEGEPSAEKLATPVVRMAVAVQ